MEQLISSLLLWLSLHSNFEYHPDMGVPKTQVVSQYMLAKIYLGNRFSQGSLSEVDKENIYNNLAERLEAVYDTKIQTIYLGERLALESAYGRSVLAHELVHFLQDINQHRAKVPCQNALEKDAYKLQVLYLKKQKLVPLLRNSDIEMLSACKKAG